MRILLVIAVVLFAGCSCMMCRLGVAPCAPLGSKCSGNHGARSQREINEEFLAACQRIREQPNGQDRLPEECPE